MYRRMLKKILIGWFILLVVVAFLGKVTIAASNAGRTAADFLLIGVGARAAAMGGAYTAVTNGASAAYWNPAGLTEVTAGEAILGHYAWYQDINLEHGTVAYRVSDRTTIATSISYLGYGQIDGRDINGQSTGDLAAYDWAGSFSVGVKATPEIDAGVTAKFINQKLDDISSSTIALDLGVKYLHERFTVAAVVANIGPDMNFAGISERIPSSGRIGISFSPFNDLLLTSIEFEKRFYGGSVIRHGFEMTFSHQYFIRAGYSFYPGDKIRAFGGGPSMGLGVRFEKAELDYAFTPHDGYSSESLHRFSFIFKFGE